MPHRFPPLRQQEPIPRPTTRAITRSLPQISLPWLEIGLGLLLLVLLRLG